MIPTREELEQKERALHELLQRCGSVLIAYSGGVDSAYLSKAALDALGKERVLAVTGRSPSYPAVQHEMAVRVARGLGLRHLEIETRELDDRNYAANPGNRCYFCKADLYRRLVDLARERGFAAVLDGSNADDAGDFRPGMIAARELGVRSPLQEAGLCKAEIRALSRRAGLPTWDLPASPCLASRIPHGLQVTARRLRQIEDAEARLRGLRRWAALRVRHHGQLARLEVDPDGLRALADLRLRREVADVLREAGFARACLDLQGYRRGAVNQALAATPKGPDIGRLASSVSNGDVAVIVPIDNNAIGELLVRRAAVVAEYRAAGFRYVTLELY